MPPKFRVPIIVGGEIRWLETRHVAPVSLPRNGWRGTVDTAVAQARGNFRPIVTGVSVVIFVFALFIVLQFLGPSWSPLLLSLAGIVAVFSCLGTRRSGTLSAYSIFNEGTQRLPGQLSADDIEREIRGGGMAGPQLPRQEPPHAPAGRGFRLGGGRGAQAAAYDGDEGDDGDVGSGDDEDERCVRSRSQRLGRPHRDCVLLSRGSAGNFKRRCVAPLQNGSSPRPVAWTTTQRDRRLPNRQPGDANVGRTGQLVRGRVWKRCGWSRRGQDCTYHQDVKAHTVEGQRMACHAHHSSATASIHTDDVPNLNKPGGSIAMRLANSLSSSVGGGKGARTVNAGETDQANQGQKTLVLHQGWHYTYGGEQVAVPSRCERGTLKRLLATLAVPSWEKSEIMICCRTVDTEV